MATLLLAAAGSALGGALGFGAVVAQAIGGLAGAVIDRALLRSGRSVEGPRLSDLDVQASTEGEPIPRVYGRVRLAGQVIWATRHEEVANEESRGGKGGVSVTSYHYYANFAVGLCEGPIHRIARVWADGTLLDTDTITMRVHHGGEDQEPDALILARQGDDAPAYRGTAYVVFERLPLDDWGNRIPQLTFEVIRVADTLEGKIRALTMIPGATEYGYATTALTRTVDGAALAENRHVTTGATDFLAALDEAIELCPELRRIALVVTWFGDDLRAGTCRVRPAVESADKVMGGLADWIFAPQTGAVWSVAGVSRAEARVVARVDGRAAYGGTPTDVSIVQAIAAIRERGLAVTLYPFLAMDIAAGNGLPDPWGGTEQAAFPWRGRITCDPAPGRPGTVDRTAAARTQIAAFVGTVPVSAFAVSGTQVVCSRPDEWSYRRMILHMAHLAVAAGGVDAFLIGSELVGLGRLRDATGAHPFVEALVALAADVRTVLGPAATLTYGADWSEWFGHHPDDGSGDVIFHLDPLWASPAIDVVGIDAWFPLTDWRPGPHLDAALADRPTDRDHLDARVAGGENYDWYYASDADRLAQIRTPIADAAHGEDWVFRPKDLFGWWSNAHHDRPAGVRSPTPTAWVPGSKPIWLTELGCPAVDLGSNDPAAFPDPKSAEARLPVFSSGVRDDFLQRRVIETVLDHWDPDRNPGNNPVSALTGRAMVDPDGIHLWAWDARPFPAFPSASDVWADASAWHNGHWLSGRLGGLSIEGLIAAVLADAGFEAVEFRAVAGCVDGFVIDRRMSTRDALDPILAAFGVDALDVGTAIRFAGRDRRVDVAVAGDELVETADAARIEWRRGQESELPGEISATFSDALLDHRRTTVSVGRRLGSSRRASGADLAVVAPIEVMCGVAEGWLADLWAGRTTASFRLDPSRVDLEPGDVVTLDVDGRAERVVITGIADGDTRAVEARTLDPAAYRPIRGGTRDRVGLLATVRGAPIVHVLDIAHAAEDADLHRPYLAAWAAPWTGPLSVRRGYDAATFVEIATIGRPAVMGVTATDLAPGPVAIWDRRTVLDVRLWGGALAGASERLVLDGANRAAVRAPSGEWEVVQFVEAELIAASTWRLSGLLRRQGGSDAAGAEIVPAGAPFVLLDDRLITLPVARDDLGRAVDLRIGPAAEAYTAASWIATTATPLGNGLRPWSPAHLAVAVDPAGGDVTVTWIRRSRVAGADSWALLEVPLGAASERWRLTLVRDGTEILTTETTSSTWTWPRAERDAALGPSPVDVTVSVAQIDGEWGVGTARAAVFRL
ncbi:baseplate multidomain protein megatron [Pinisolibacter aquiterrae]|uniref:baseplate multidomain protein megatron n=1 Tax=Pinisolibacter aquiterrae TaxID=2815579 RepID=UPI001C3C7F73|nr:glycoside hydrolase/phage tail family protein [Pinisolibacter aquiterrae]MBV5263164.1 glycoside hydrolase/phage tail family protein [Pinisolibacter aquiterrae]MCC8234078.1 glycoside hydrolase/phage tail family protein [Pinisolibacter aquiterrae]